MSPLNNKSMMMNTRPGRIGGNFDESEMPSNNLWVGNLASDVADLDLMDLFAQYVVKVAKDTLQGTDLHGHPIKIKFARPLYHSKIPCLGCYQYRSLSSFDFRLSLPLLSVNRF
nr:flowering time control protein fpa [Quercus suber]